MSAPASFRKLLESAQPILALAPMQDVTDLPFLKLMTRYGGPDLVFTEYFRVHTTSNLEPGILESITQNPTGRPIAAQMIGNDIPALIRTAQLLQQHPAAAIDLNLGCPAPVVYRKCAGGGLLREPARVDAILGALRDTIHIPFTVKTRIGFDTPHQFHELLEVFARHRLDLLTVHARTVKQMYRPPVHYDAIARAVAHLPFPVLANGNVDSPSAALDILQTTGARGLMIGRGAIRNPWLFNQIRQAFQGLTPTLPTGVEVLAYIHDLYHSLKPPNFREAAQVQKMKKYLNFIGEGVEPAEPFLHQIRRVETELDFFTICETFLNHDRPLPLHGQRPTPPDPSHALTPAAA